MSTRTESSDPDDWQLAVRARDGDEAAYEQLIERHQAATHAFIFRYVGNSATASDLAQETFVRAWFGLDRVRPKAKFTTWLFQIAINLCRDYAKSKAGRQSRLAEPLVSHSADGDEYEREFAAAGPLPDADAQFGELQAMLGREIARLPIKLRESFILGVIEERSHKEVAEIVKASPKAVEVRIHRARQLLSTRLAQAGVIDSVAPD